MKTLFDAAESADIEARLRRITADARPVWGKMTAAQTMAHCQAPLLVARGEMPIHRGLVAILFGRIAAKKLSGPKPFGKNLPTAPEFVVRDAKDFVRERDRLIELVREASRRGPAGLRRDPHPFFGPLTVPQWEALLWKHLDHHLRQFGA